MLAAAESMYNFGKANQGTYTNSVPNVNKFYGCVRRWSHVHISKSHSFQNSPLFILLSCRTKRKSSEDMLWCFVVVVLFCFCLFFNGKGCVFTLFYYWVRARNGGFYHVETAEGVIVITSRREERGSEHVGAGTDCYWCQGERGLISCCDDRARGACLVVMTSEWEGLD